MHIKKIQWYKRFYNTNARFLEAQFPSLRATIIWCPKDTQVMLSICKTDTCVNICIHTFHTVAVYHVYCSAHCIFYLAILIIKYFL